VSDEEMERLRVETEALAAELSRLKNESELLDRALTNVYREKDRVVDRLNVLSGDPSALAEDAAAPAAGDAAGAAGDGTAPAGGAQPGAPGAAGETAGRKTHAVKSGDYLSGIASSNGTTVQELLRLNPYLASRPANVIWEGDQLILPD
jgi:LysM repeat protein